MGYREFQPVIRDPNRFLPHWFYMPVTVITNDFGDTKYTKPGITVAGWLAITIAALGSLQAYEIASRFELFN